MSDEHKMTHEEWANIHSREASREHVERETELEKLRNDKAALLAACKAYREQHDALQWARRRPCPCDTCTSTQKIIDEVQAETL